MAFLNKINWNFLRKNSQNSSGIDPSAPIQNVQNQLDNYKREFQEVVGLAAGNDRISALITAARQFSWQAAKAGQNLPHTVRIAIRTYISDIS